MNPSWMSPLLEMILRLFLAAALGAAIGCERERAKKPAGLRTHILIALGAALFTVVSMYGFANGVDPSRVAAGVVVGLTTAASVWIAAAVGLAAGAGMYLISVFVAAIAVLVLMIPKARG